MRGPSELTKRDGVFIILDFPAAEETAGKLWADGREYVLVLISHAWQLFTKSERKSLSGRSQAQARIRHCYLARALRALTCWLAIGDAAALCSAHQEHTTRHSKHMTDSTARGCVPGPRHTPISNVTSCFWEWTLAVACASCPNSAAPLMLESQPHCKGAGQTFPLQGNRPCSCLCMRQ